MSPTRAPGTVIDGKFRVERLLGRGGMGVVLEATHLALGKRVALKVLHIDAADSLARQRFAREARIAAQLPSEHIAQVSDFGETEAGEPYLVMELLTGNDLERELRTRGRLPCAEAVDLVLQASEGVADAHVAGLVHRDLKPANLFLSRRRDGSPLIKVLDFGVSKMQSESHQNLTSTESTFGTPQYMSPEQIRSAKYVDARTDQHALAMILYELACGKPPYVAESVTGLYVVISTTAPVPMRAHSPDVPPGLEVAILRALAKDPAGRFPDVAAFAEALAPFGGPGAGAAAIRMAATFGREAPRLSHPIGAAVPHAAGHTTAAVAVSTNDGAPPWQPVSLGETPNPPAPPAPRSQTDTQSALERDPARAPARHARVARVALAVGVSAAVLVGVTLVAWRAVPRSAAADVTPDVTPAATAIPPAAIDGTVAASAPIPAAVTAQAEAEAPAVSATAEALAPESVPSMGKPPRSHPAATGRKKGDTASDVFGQRRK